MDPAISWLQPEQDGPAKLLWVRIWQTQLELESLNLKENDSDMDGITNGFHHTNREMNGKTDKSAIVSRRRKVDYRSGNRHKSFNDGECPWRVSKFPYGLGVLG